ncbi:signal peptidase I [Candidatus Saccharibacteria bacterium 32-49-12]|nr:MAG: signal peptidase I [Candidatus Saccharibacteria bacterium 32-49-12]
MQASYLTRHPFAKDVINVVIFVVLVIIGTTFINAFVFRSFNVVGPSMKETLHSGDRLIVNRLPVTWDKLRNRPYVPERGQVIVFLNPKYIPGVEEQYIVKRVIGLPGEKVVLDNGVFTVYNDEFPNGFNPDDSFDDQPLGPASHEIITTVPDGHLFVTGDNRVGNNSYDSRSGLGPIPIYDVVGPVSVRIFPFDDLRFF